MNQADTNPPFLNLTRPRLHRGKERERGGENLNELEQERRSYIN